MMYLVPYSGAHFAALGSLQAAQSDWTRTITPAVARGLETPYSMTAMHNGVPVACGGILPIWDHRGYVWSFFSDRMTARLFYRAHTLTKRAIDSAPFKRIEAAVEVDFEAGHRWIKALGFICETPTTVARHYLPNGADCLLYARIKEA